MSLCNTDIQLPPLTRLGTNYSTLTNIQPRFESGVVQLISGPVSAISMFLWVTLTTVLLVLFGYLSWPQAEIQMGALAAPLFITVALLALLAPPAMALIHKSSCSRVNPLIEIDLNHGLVRICRGQKTFPLTSVHSLIAASVPNAEGELLAELQLLIQSDKTIVAELVCTKYNSSSRRAFGRALSAISQHCPFPLLVVEPKGFFRRGPL